MGLCWSGPQQLALALLADHLGDDERALALCRSFMERLTSQLDNDWQLTAADISAELEKDLPQGEFSLQTYH